MIKKSQEAVLKKNDLGKELSKTNTIILYADRNIKITIKYVTTTLPANLNPSYDVSSIDINKKYLKNNSGEDSNVALVK